MKTASAAEIESKFGSFLKASESGPVVVTKNGKAVAVILGVRDEDDIEQLAMAYSPRLRTVLEKSRKQIRERDVLDHEEFWKEVKASRTSKPGRKQKD